MEIEGARSGVAHLTHNAMRIVVGLLFWLHGLQKLFGMFGFEEPVELASRLGVRYRDHRRPPDRPGPVHSAGGLHPGRRDGGRLLHGTPPPELLAHHE